MSKGEKMASISDDTKSLAVLVLAMVLFVSGMVFSGSSPTIGGAVMLLGGLTFFGGVLLIIKSRRKAASIEEDPNVNPEAAPNFSTQTSELGSVPGGSPAPAADIAPGWRVDPYGIHQLRFFDGQWRDDVSDDGVVSRDPVPADSEASAAGSGRIRPPAAPAGTSSEGASVLQSAAFRNAVYGSAQPAVAPSISVFTPEPAVASAAAPATSSYGPPVGEPSALPTLPADFGPGTIAPPVPAPSVPAVPARPGPGSVPEQVTAEEAPIAHLPIARTPIPAQVTVEAANAADLSSAPGGPNPWAPIAPSSADSPWNQGTAPPEPEREVASADETRLTAWRHFGAVDSGGVGGDDSAAVLQTSSVTLLDTLEDLDVEAARLSDPIASSTGAQDAAGTQSGWYPDPLDAASARYFDGAGWTELTRAL